MLELGRMGNKEDHECKDLNSWRNQPKDYSSSQYMRVFRRKLNDDIAMVSSRPGSVSTAREGR
jgi:hypothetical protein